MMLAWRIGWQEVVLILLVLVGIIVGPLPLRRRLGRQAKPAQWSSHFRVAQVESIHVVAEAFFCSYSEGEYTLADRERFRLTFRRGAWRVADGELLPAAEADVEPQSLPIVLRVLFQPRADSLQITLRHEAAVTGKLPAATRKLLSAAFKREARDFQAYLQDNFDAGSFPSRRPTKRIDATWRSG